MTPQELQEGKYEYMLHTWGGFYNKENVSIHKYKPGYFYFDCMKDLEDHLNVLKKISDNMKAINPESFAELVYDVQEGRDVRFRTIAYITAKYKGKEYDFEYDFGPCYPEESAEFMFEEGNYSCDCNLSSFIKEKYKDFPELNCGEEIEISLEIIKSK